MSPLIAAPLALLQGVALPPPDDPQVGHRALERTSSRVAFAVSWLVYAVTVVLA